MAHEFRDVSFRGKLIFVWNVLRKQRKYIVGLLMLQVLFSLLNSVIPYFSKLQIDQLTGEGTAEVFARTGINSVTLFLIFLLIPAFLELIRLLLFEAAKSTVEMVFYRHLRHDSDLLIRQKLVSFDLGFFESERNRNLLHATYGSSRTFSRFFGFVSNQLGEFTRLATIIPLLGFVNFQLMLMVLVASLVQTFIQSMMRKNTELNSAVEEQVRHRRNVLSTALDRDFAILRSFGVLPRFVKEFNALDEKIDDFNLQQEKVDRIFRTFQWVVDNFLTIGVNIFAGYQVINGNLSIGSFTLVVSYTLQLNSIFRSLMSTVSEWQEIELDLSKLQFFFSLKSRLKTGMKKLTFLKKPVQLEVQNVAFAYPDFYEDERKYFEFVIQRTRNVMKRYSYSYLQYEINNWEELLKPHPSTEVLENVNFSLETGKLVALLGRNGAGKTTITHLLQHHYEPLKGQVLLNGEPLYEYDQEFFVQQFSLLQQQPFLVESLSIRENLLIGVQREKSEGEIWHVLEELEMKTFIEKLPKQLDSIIGSDTNLSGGQKQLLGVARVLLEPHPIILFDEGSSQLDVEKEYLVLQALKRRQSQSAILFITHRISVARKADTILMIDGGRIIESGSHTELLKKNGLYSTFWNLQVIE